MLARRGHDVHAAASINDAVASVYFDLPFVPDAAIVDLVLPDGNGADVASRLRSHFQATKFVFITGWRETERSSLAAQVFGPVLRKPFLTEHLLDALNERR
jgi:DNA-binding response OmpR family regulator